MTSNQSIEANGPIAMRVQCVCHDTLPWLISFSLDACSASLQFGRRGCSGLADFMCYVTDNCAMALRDSRSVN